MRCDALSLGGEVGVCSVGCMLGMPEISPFVSIAASYQLHGISRTKEMFFQAGVFWVWRNFLVFSDWHEIVIWFPLHLMLVGTLCRTPQAAALFSLL